MVKQTVIIEKTGVFSKKGEERYEYTVECKEQRGKKILVICTNPASDKLDIVDTTTNYLTNNLFQMGYSTITLCNLYANITGKLQPSKVESNIDNMEYIESVLAKNFDQILVGFGNTFNGNGRVKEEKAALYNILKPYAKKLVEITDSDGKYNTLKTIHPLFAGQRFSGKWELKKFALPNGEALQKKERKNVHQSI